MKHLITIDELDSDEILEILELASIFKKQRQRGEYSSPLKNKSLGMIFEKHSTRTRVSFEIAMFQLGGHAVYLNANDLHLGSGESFMDTISMLTRYLDAIMIRTNNHSDVEKLAEVSQIPIINGNTSMHHPCQILADLLSIYEHKNTFHNLKLAYIGIAKNILNSLLIACSKLGINIHVATPFKEEIPNEILAKSLSYADKNKSEIIITEDILSAAKGADVIYTSSWVLDNRSEKVNKHSILKEYQVNGFVFVTAKENCLFMHDMPAFRGIEVTEDIIDGSQSIVWQQAENRLYVQKAILQMLLK